jgi:phosphoglycerate kinase
MAKLTIEDIPINAQRVLMRVDFNVPLKAGSVANDKRIRAALPTIQYILNNGGKLILMSHLGRPKGQRRPEMSLAPCAAKLSEHIGKPVQFVDDCIGEKALSASKKLASGQVLLLENLRFYPGETDNDPEFAQQLARLGDVYVNDAFGTAHRAHGSTAGVTRFLQPSVAGYLMMKELQYLGQALEMPQTPFVAILGGAKISGKIDVLQHLLPKVDRLIVGGGMAFTFLHAKGFSIGKSLLEKDKVALAKQLLEMAGDKIVLPKDCLVSDDVDFDAGRVGPLQAVTVEAIPDNCMALDIGPESVAYFKDALASAQTVVWNGPMGVFEIDATAKGTFEIAKLLAQLTVKGTTSIIGGGDSAAAAEQAGVADSISHISTGGGASLEFLEGKTLPGIAALTDADK